MGKFIIITVLVLAAGGIFFYMAKDSTPKIQKEYKIVAFGDSLTAGYGVESADSYPSVLEKRLQEINPNVTIINMGLSGDTSAGGLKRIDAVIKEAPHTVLLGLGGNDMLRSRNVDEVKANLEAMIIQFQKNNINVVLLGVKGSIANTKEYRDRFNAVYTDLAEKYNLVVVEDFLKGVVLRADLNIADRLHPNATGYVKIVDENVMPEVKGLFR